MREFKFFRNPPRSLLHNEQVLNYWTGYYDNTVSTVIAWSRDIHIDSACHSFRPVRRSPRWESAC